MCACVHALVCVFAMVCMWRPEADFQESVFFFRHVVSEVLRFGGEMSLLTEQSDQPAPQRV